MAAHRGYRDRWLALLLDSVGHVAGFPGVAADLILGRAAGAQPHPRPSADTTHSGDPPPAGVVSLQNESCWTSYDYNLSPGNGVRHGANPVTLDTSRRIPSRRAIVPDHMRALAGEPLEAACGLCAYGNGRRRPYKYGDDQLNKTGRAQQKIDCRRWSTWTSHWPFAHRGRRTRDQAGANRRPSGGTMLPAEGTRMTFAYSAQPRSRDWNHDRRTAEDMKRSLARDKVRVRLRPCAYRSPNRPA